jgi:hypothetical protein
MASSFLATHANSMEPAVMRRTKHRSLLVESLETKVVLSSSGAAGHLELSRAVHADVFKVNKAAVSEGKITGSADAFSIGIELISGTASVRALGSLRVSSGLSAYMFVRNTQGAVTARVAVGFVDLEKPKGHQWVAVMTFDAPQTDTTYGKTNTLEYTLYRWIRASQRGGSGSFGNVILSGTATLRFPDGLPTSGETPVPFNMILRGSD